MDPDMIPSSIDQTADTPPEVGTGGARSERLEHGCAMGCLAIIFGIPAVWLYWMARTFVDGDTWYDFIVRSILDELILALGLFAIVMVVAGFFPYPRLTRIVNWAMEHMAMTVLVVFWGMVGSLLLFIVVFAVLDTLGIKF